MGFVCAYFASKRGRNPIVWFIIGLFCSFLGLAILLVLPPKDEEIPKSWGDKSNSRTIELTLQEEKKNLPEPFSNENWFYLNEKHEQFGPYVFNDIISFFKDGKIKATSYVWNVGMQSWKTISELPEILQALQK